MAVELFREKVELAIVELCEDGSLVAFDLISACGLTGVDVIAKLNVAPGKPT